MGDEGVRIGTVGWSGQLTMTGEAVVREYYRKAAQTDGWTLKSEITDDPAQAGGLDLGYPDLCFQNDDENGVVLEVTFEGHPRDRVRIIFVEVRFAGEDLTCAQHFQ